jgi:Zn-dependent M28 family amino/carboxypeptidase
VLNLDMIGRDEAHIPQSQGAIEIPADTSNHMNLIGGYYSPDLVATLRRANGNRGLTLDTKFDRDYKLNTLFRCDHLPFLLAGVPSIWIFGGFHPGYHEPVDTMDRLNYPKIAEAIDLAHRAAVDVADAAAPPRFLRGPVRP